MNDAETLANSLKLGGRTEDLSDYVFFKDEEFPFGDANMTEVCAFRMKGELNLPDVIFF